MCGIGGIVSLTSRPVPAAALQAMAGAMVHRGPDDEGVFAGERAGLAVRRLSIIGLANGHQPIFNEDESVAVVANGEIYNYAELRAELEAKGHRFSTESDVETLVHLYEEEGERFVERLRGMFALALYDRANDRLYVVRDRAGQKPVYYAVHDGLLVFGSEIKALHASGLVPKRLDEDALTSYLIYGFVVGEATLFDGVRKLPAGCLMTLATDGPAVRPYWDLPEPATGVVAFGEAVERVRELTEEAVRLRLISEVPLGAFLSGGIDSSVVVGLMSRLLGDPPATFSVGFDDAELDERPHARRVARRFRTRHHEVLVRDCGPGLLREINWYCDEPASDPAAVPTFCLTRFARRHITVSLTGEGGDEAFAGYAHYRNLLRLRRFGRLPGAARAARTFGWVEPLLGSLGSGRLKKSMWMAGLAPEERARGWAAAFTDRELARVLRPGLRRLDAFRRLFRDLQARRGAGDEMSQLLYVDTKLALADQLLMKVDKTTMASSLEARSPLLDHRLLEYAAALPIAMKITAGETKRVLRHAFAELLPPEITGRRKKGFDVPLKRWLTRDLRGLTEELLLADGAAVGRYFDIDGIRGLWSGYERRGDARAARQLWRLLCFADWHEMHWPRHGEPYEPPQRGESAPYADARYTDFSRLPRERR